MVGITHGQAPARRRYDSHPTGLSDEELEAEIKRLKRERNAVILAHYYQESEMQDLADYVGDSLQLSQAAAKTQADVIAFCGVHFMAETAKILNPTRSSSSPTSTAGCSLADGCPAPVFAEVARAVPGPHGRQLHQLLGRGEGAVRRHLHVVERGEDRQGARRREDRVRARTATSARSSRSRRTAPTSCRGRAPASSTRRSPSAGCSS